MTDIIEETVTDWTIEVQNLAVKMFNETDEVHKNLLVVRYVDDLNRECYQAFMRGVIFYYKPEGIRGNLGYQHTISGVAIGSGTTFLRLDTVLDAEIKPYGEVMDKFQYNGHTVEAAESMTAKKVADDAAKAEPVPSDEPVVEE